MSNIAFSDGVVLNPRCPVGLMYVEGDVFPYNDYPLPEIFYSPLRKRTYQPTIGGLASGKRSAVIASNDGWFKYKGIIPLSKEYGGRGEPVGGMTEKTSKKEFVINEKINQIYGEYGCASPITPAAQVRFEKYFNGEKIFANINKIEGDTRLHVLINRTIEKKDTKPLRELSKGIYSWKGFSDRVLKEARIRLSPIDDDLSNTVIYNVDGGFGLEKVDYELTDICNSDGWENPNLLKEMNCLPFNIILRDVYNNLNEDITPLDMIAAFITTIKNGDEKIERIEDEINVYANEKRLELVGEMEKEYYKVYEGNYVPEPINKNLIKWFFS